MLSNWKNKMNIEILGAGAFGKSLAAVFASKHTVSLITQSTNFSPNPDIAFAAAPAQNIKDVTKKLQSLPSKTPIIFCSKGLFIENNKPYFMTTYAAQYLQNPLYVLSGPNFASELMDLKKSFANIAGPNAKKLCHDLTQEHFILEPWHDPIGLQLAGCLKNVFAIACGYYQGTGKGLNERAALFTQACQEMIILGECFWPKTFDPASLLTYGGIGDLVLTCTSTESRNFKLGLALATGQTFTDYKATNIAIAEGAYTATAINSIKGKLDLPICDLVYQLCQS